MSRKRVIAAPQHRLAEGLKQALEEKRAGRVVGPFTTARDAMDFLNEYQRLLLLVEQALREAARLSRRYDPEKVRWLLDLEDSALKQKLSKRSRS